MINSIHCPDIDELDGLLEDALASDRRVELEDHLEHCATCQEKVATLDVDPVVANYLKAPSAVVDPMLQGMMEKAKATDRWADPVDTTHAQASLDFLIPSDNAEFIGRLGRYEITEIVGRGGMGIVLKGYDPQLKRVVAIKVLAPELASNVNARKRFRREGQAAAAVSHDHVVTIHAVDEANGLPHLVMEYVSGRSLQDRIQQDGPLELDEILRIGVQAASGLAAAHAQGLVHRDIKPANILLENSVERVKITDFGLARAVDDVKITRPGVVTGTPEYMSPEQARGESMDHRSDLFSLGSVLYAMCTGRPPFRAESTVAMIRRVCDDQPRRVQELNPQIPDFLADVIDKLLAKDPDLRFDSATEVESLLENYLAHLQNPAAIPSPPSIQFTGRSRRNNNRSLNRNWLVAFVLLLSICTLGVITDASGFTQFGGTVIRIVRGEGVVVLEVDDPDVQVSLDGDQVVITGAGPQMIRLPTGQHELKANKADETVYHQVVTVSRGGRQIVRVRAGSDSRRQTVRHVWPDRVTKRGAPSPDGRYLTATDWDTGDLAVFDVTTKKLRRITNIGPWSESAEFAEHHIWSPDGQRIAYSWYSDEADAYELRVVSASGKDVAEPRVISKHEYLIPYAWSPDGDYILAAVEQPNEPFGLKKIFISDGTIRLLKALDGGYPVKASISPDGKYVVYDTEDELHIVEVEDDAESDKVLLSGSSGDYGPLWSPDGKHVVFISDRSGSVSLWVQRVDGGVARGNPQPVGIDMNYMAPLGISNDGTYFYGDVLFSDSTDIHVLTLDNGSNPERLTLRFSGVNRAPTWSPDGKQLAYLSHRSPMAHASSLISHSLATGDERVLLRSAEVFMPGQQPLWSPDGATLLLVGRRGDDDEKGVSTVDFESGEATWLTTSVAPDERLISGAWSPDSKAIYFIRARAYSASNPGRSSLIVKMDIATRTETTVHEQPTKALDKTPHQVFPGALAVSPDGRRLAVANRQAITLVPSVGGPPTPLIELQADQQISLAAGLVWTADGQSLFFATGSSDEAMRWPTRVDKNHLWRVDVGSGERHKLNIDIRGLGHMVLHPDARRIAMTATTDDLPVRSGILALDNFLPPSDY